MVDAAESCDDKRKLLIGTINIGLDIIMPVKHFKVHTDDPSWVTAEFKQLIKLRQDAFTDRDVDRFRHLRNVVNRKRKVLRCKYYASKVSCRRDTKPGQWWSAVKRIAGMVPACDSKCLFTDLQLEGSNVISGDLEPANTINATFLKPIESFTPLAVMSSNLEDQTSFTVTEAAVLKALKKLNPRKAAGPDRVPSRLC